MDHQLQCPLNLNETMHGNFPAGFPDSFYFPTNFSKKNAGRNTYNQNNNIGFFIGKATRDLWDGSVGYISNYWGLAADYVSSYFYGSKPDLTVTPEIIEMPKVIKSPVTFKNLPLSFNRKEDRSTRFYNIEDFDPIVHQNINAKECVEERKEQCEKGYPQALVLKGNFFNSEQDRHWRENIFPTNNRYKMFRNWLAKENRVHDHKVSNTQELCDIVKYAHSLGPIKFFYIQLHGNPGEIFLGETGNIITDRLNVDFYLFLNNGKQDLSCLELLDKDSVMIIFSCDTAGDYHLQFRNTYAVHMNIHKLFALHAPNTRTFAPHFSVESDSLAIRKSPDFEVYGKGTVLIEGKNVTDEFQFEEISRNKAPFCKEALPYYTMKKFCDNANIKPSEELLQACEKEPGCHKMVKMLCFNQRGVRK